MLCGAVSGRPGETHFSCSVLEMKRNARHALQQSEGQTTIEWNAYSRLKTLVESGDAE